MASSVSSAAIFFFAALSFVLSSVVTPDSNPLSTLSRRRQL
jgi:hypothetical protein